MKSTKLCDLAVLLLGLAALTACSDHNPETATAAPTPTPTVSASTTEAELKSWKSEERVLQSDFARAKKLWDAQLIPLEQFEHTKYKAEEEHYEVQRVEQLLITTKANQQSLELELEKTRIRAPFAGV